MKPLFVRVEGRKRQVRHNTGVWAVDTARLYMGLLGDVGNGCFEPAPFNTRAQKD